VTTLPLMAPASLTHAHHISHFERQRGSSYGQDIQPSSAFALAVRHELSPMGDWLPGTQLAYLQTYCEALSCPATAGQ
jgi:hypothetical protein